MQGGEKLKLKYKQLDGFVYNEGCDNTESRTQQALLGKLC